MRGEGSSRYEWTLHLLHPWCRQQRIPSAVNRRQFRDSADTITACATEMNESLKASELTETKAFVGSFIKEVMVRPGRAAIVYSIPTQDDSPIGGADATKIILSGGVMNWELYTQPTKAPRWEQGAFNECWHESDVGRLTG